jgi:hypothetical protein
LFLLSFCVFLHILSTKRHALLPNKPSSRSIGCLGYCTLKKIFVLSVKETNN